ncbi:MAG: hypothetical protein ACK5WW_12615 [Brevundimonas sp.]|jgi:hypothetical protein|nr:hypothetical protein [Brevundimonas sp.]MCZ8085701.1 hypothetical protein [Brevundimonas sp.]MCZ8194719.1 hypothetical protein [Brevundimonas sp.]
MHDDSREWLEGLRLVGIALVSALLTASVVIAAAETLRPAVAGVPEGASR